MSSHFTLGLRSFRVAGLTVALFAAMCTPLLAQAPPSGSRGSTKQNFSRPQPSATTIARFSTGTIGFSETPAGKAKNKSREDATWERLILFATR